MKKSTIVTLVLSGALISACDQRRPYAYAVNATGTNVTNNAYVPGLGYYHAPYHDWFLYPYNYYRPGFGYYHGGFYSPQPDMSDISSSRPGRIPGLVGGGGGFSGSHVGSGGASSSVSRGGFGSIGHGGSISS